MSVIQSESKQTHEFDTKTLSGYLFGGREAILAATNTPGCLWLGLLFVLSAGFAREYNKEDLLREPWHLLLPLVASLVTSFVLYLLLYWKLSATQSGMLDFGVGYRKFLSLYWLTAPLAWVYAIPVENFLPPLEATQLNFALLAIVSVWRVLLITRAICVWLNARWWSALPLVLWFADSVLMILAYTVPRPIFSIMGGMHHLSETESFIAGIGFSTMILSTMAWPILAIIAAVVTVIDRNWQVSNGVVPYCGHVGKSAWLLGIASLVVWAFVLPFSQPPLQRASHAKTLLESEKVSEAFTYMSQFDRGDFPSNWDPPPRIGYGENRPSIFTLEESLGIAKVAPWVEQVFQQKVTQAMPQLINGLIPHHEESPMTEDDLVKFHKVFESIEVNMSRNEISNDYEIEYTLHRALDRPEIEEPIKARIRKHLGLKEEVKAAPPEDAAKEEDSRDGQSD